MSICESQALKPSSPDEAHNNSLKESTLLCKENKLNEKISNVMFLQTFSTSLESKYNELRLARCLLDGKAKRTFIEKEIAGRETLIIYPFGNK